MEDKKYNSIEKCFICGTNLIFSETPNTIHHGRLDCPNCKVFRGWSKKPENEGQRTKSSKYSLEQIMKFHNFNDEEFCFFCLRLRKQLGEYETITIDHIKELDKDGKDELGNLQILCSSCHKLKNWARLYMNWHFKK